MQNIKTNINIDEIKNQNNIDLKNNKQSEKDINNY